MKILKVKSKKTGFSLTEVAIALLIVAVLAAVTIPIIGRQLEKTDEYAYYMAFRSVEKMAAQIVAYGDPQEDINFESSSSIPVQTKVAQAKPNSDKGFIYYIKHKSQLAKNYRKAVSKLAYAENYIFSKLFPKTLALTDSGVVENENVYEWYSDEFDRRWLQVAVCKNFNQTGSPRHDVPCMKGDKRAEVTVVTTFRRMDEEGSYESGDATGGSVNFDASAFLTGATFPGKIDLDDLMSRPQIYTQADVDWVNSYISTNTDSEGKYTVYHRPKTGNLTRDELYPVCLIDCSQYNSDFVYSLSFNLLDDENGGTFNRIIEDNELGLTPHIFMFGDPISENEDFQSITKTHAKAIRHKVLFIMT